MLTSEQLTSEWSSRHTSWGGEGEGGERCRVKVSYSAWAKHLASKTNRLSQAAPGNTTDPESTRAAPSHDHITDGSHTPLYWIGLLCSNKKTLLWIFLYEETSLC